MGSPPDPPATRGGTNAPPSDPRAPTGAGRSKKTGETRTKWIIGLAVPALLGPLTILFVTRNLEPSAPLGGEIPGFEFVSRDPCCEFSVDFSVKGFEGRTLAMKTEVRNDDTGERQPLVDAFDINPPSDEYRSSDTAKVEIEDPGDYEVSFVLHDPEGRVLDRASTGVFSHAGEIDGEILNVELQRNDPCCSFLAHYSLQEFSGKLARVEAAVTDAETRVERTRIVAAEVTPDSDTYENTALADIQLEPGRNYVITFYLYGPGREELHRRSMDPIFVDSRPDGEISGVHFNRLDPCCSFSVHYHVQGLTGQAVAIHAYVVDYHAEAQVFDVHVADVTPSQDQMMDQITAEVPIAGPGEFYVIFTLYGPDGGALDTQPSESFVVG
jgi:hypothetical protein